MHYFDILILIPLLWSAYLGFKKGLIIEMASILALLFGIYGAIGFSDYTSGFIRDKLNITSSYLGIISFAITFLAIVIVIFLLAKLLEKVVKLAALGIANRIGGVLFASAKSLVVISAIIFVLGIFDTQQKLFTPNLRQKSLLFNPISQLVQAVFPSIKNLNAGQSLARLSDTKSFSQNN